MPSFALYIFEKLENLPRNNILTKSDQVGIFLDLKTNQIPGYET
jgi:hypothetical protein